MLTKLLMLACACAFTLAASEHITGTWKLNVAKSKYTGIPMPKDLTVTYTPKGSGWDYKAVGASGDGMAINSSFSFVKDGEEAKMTGFPYGDAIVVSNGNMAVGTATLKRDGKTVGTVKRMVAKDGKTMTLNGNVTLADGKKATYRAVYDKQ